MVNKISVNLVRNKVMIQISKLKKETKIKKQAKYDQNVITVLEIKQKHGQNKNKFFDL